MRKVKLMIQPRSSFVTIDALRLHYLEWDPAQLPAAEATPQHRENDDIPLVMLHGLGASADTWRLVADPLCRQRQVIAFDLRGHGQSDQPDDGYDLASVAEDVIRGMAALGLGQVALIGHGWVRASPWLWPCVIPRSSAISSSSIAPTSSRSTGPA